jgi:hypothetical protein
MGLLNCDNSKEIFMWHLNPGTESLGICIVIYASQFNKLFEVPILYHVGKVLLPSASSQCKREAEEINQERQYKEGEYRERKDLEITITQLKFLAMI